MSVPSPPSFVAAFDSASAMVRATAAALRGHEAPNVGVSPILAPVARALNSAPRRVKKAVYSWAGWMEAIPPSKLSSVRAEDVSAWVADSYPQRRYPAAFIGATNGALVHVCAALGAPWLPQTVLIPVRRHGDPDEPGAAMRWGREWGPRILEANPDLQLHHMHDPSQDRLMIRHMTYFRVKRLRLGAVYERFLRERLRPGAPIYVVDCNSRWPVTRIGERHFFQHGAQGGASADEYHRGGERVRDFLSAHGADRSRWEAPEPTTHAPEAEWGFEPALEDDVGRVADECGYKVRWIHFGDPEDLSPAVADLYMSWLSDAGRAPGHLLVESFILQAPWSTLDPGVVPFWTKFPVEPSIDSLERYLDDHSFNDIGAFLFSHGTDSIGLAGIERWRSALGRARGEGTFLGVDERHFPRDFATYTRYLRALDRWTEKARGEAPPPMTIEQMESYLPVD